VAIMASKTVGMRLRRNPEAAAATAHEPGIRENVLTRPLDSFSPHELLEPCMISERDHRLVPAVVERAVPVEVAGIEWVQDHAIQRAHAERLPTPPLVFGREVPPLIPGELAEILHRVGAGERELEEPP